MPAKKRSRKALYIILSITGLLLIGLLFINIYLSKRVMRTLKERIEQGSNGEYSFNAKSLKVNIFTRSVDIVDFVLAPTEEIAENKSRFIVRSSSLSVSGIALTSFIRNKDLIISNISLEDPHISFYQKGNSNKDIDSAMNELSILKMMKPGINSIVIDEIDISDANFSIFGKSKDTVALLSAKKNNILIKGFKVDESTDRSDRLFFADKFEIEMEDFSYHLPDKLYTIHGKRLIASYTDSLIKIDSFQLVPKFSRKDFGSKAGRQATRVSLTSSSISLNSADVSLFLEQNSLIGRKLSLKGFVIDTYRDNNIPLEPVERPSLQSLIKDIPLTISIDSIEVYDAMAVHQEKAEGRKEISNMTLDKINGLITGITNDSLKINQKSIIKASLNAVFMKKGLFKITYTFPLMPDNEISTCDGMLGPLPIIAIDPLIEPSKGISIVSGNVDSMTFNFRTDGNISNGKMILAYRDLKVDMVDDSSAKLKDKFMDFFANNVVLIESNPGTGGRLREVNVGVQKNKYRYYPFHFMQTLLSGITASIEGEKKSKLLKKTGLFGKK